VRICRQISTFLKSVPPLSSGPTNIDLKPDVKMKIVFSTVVINAHRSLSFCVQQQICVIIELRKHNTSMDEYRMDEYRMDD
jgi:hypothetical protein